MTKKILALLLCVFMLMAVIPTMASAEEAETVNGKLVAMVDHGGVKHIEAYGGMPTDFEGFLGTIVQTGAYPITVTSLGRLFYEGNSQEHTLKLVDAVTGEDVPGATVTVSGGVVDQFTYGQLAEPVTLNANSKYYLLSSESSAGDFFSDSCDVMYSDSVANCMGFVKQTADGYSTFAFANSGYVSLNMEFTYTPNAYEGEEIEAFMDIKWDIVRNNYHSYIGLKFITGSDELIITELGRIFLDGNVQAHSVKLVDGVTFEDVPGANVIIQGGTHGKITYAKLESPVVLKPDYPYLLMSREYNNGDTWLEGNARYLVTDDDDIMVMGGNYFITGYNDVISLDTGFVGLNLKYIKAEKEEKPTEPAATDPKPGEDEKDPTEAPTQAPTQAPTTGKQEAPSNSTWIIIVAAVVVVAAVAIVVVIRKKKK